ncbi:MULTISPECIES: hypothetical protein [Prochlorococcus]|uniref:hypothetical protein n=1 Tax=Prochlorococcus TaxID=1218 RepID=UPI0007B33C7D|nr:MULTISPECIES: hypothetical protein [Prochlorococcus]KZR66655.1 hypothetical protein PMIT1312_00779 [Prochlorococcus marinus str. MIT 1312]KZR83228.1 hypothetical protein PMIT1327_00615 [Prochlorococcus marinus str. MIT 1327]NMO84109.1 hypothetical protein [Prochlorococcus sp. P1344]NMP05839.1 hypothetical protein [Prochlorococcus sp. P1361]NMP12616.1 hypothetical protein [Prochlorococcus sp.P1363]
MIDDGDLINIVTLPQHLHCFDQTDGDHLNFGASRYFFCKGQSLEKLQKILLEAVSKRNFPVEESLNQLKALLLRV